MSFFKKLFGNEDKAENKAQDKKENFDINTPVENPRLVAAMQAFFTNKSEDTLSEFITALLHTRFLVLTYNDEMDVQNDGANSVIKENSVLKFLNCFDSEGNAYLPLFTDWKQVNQWLEKPDQNIGGFVMDTFEAFEFAKSGEGNGIIINPSSEPWIMSNEQIGNFLDDFKK